MFDYKAKPFYLSDEDIRWVEDTWQGMTTEEKIGQLFCPIEMSTDEAELRRDVEERHIGGVLYRVGEAKEILESHRILQKYSKIPIFTASNLEMGGSGSAVEGTYYGVEMLVSATDNVERAYQLGKVSCKEGAAVGVNWAFAPIVDIDNNFRNPITNVRTFGADKDKVKAMGAAYLRAAKEEGVAACIKHGRARPAPVNQREFPKLRGMGRDLRRYLQIADRRGRADADGGPYRDAGLRGTV